MNAKNGKFQVGSILLKIPAAIFYGWIFWLFLEQVQADFVGKMYDCCERCGNILYDREQPVLSVCAGVALFVCFLPDTRGFKGILKIVGLAFLSFQIYSITTIWSVLHSEECSALHRVRAFPLAALLILIIEMLVLSGIWAFFCSVPLVIFGAVRSFVFRRDDKFQNLGMK